MVNVTRENFIELSNDLIRRLPSAAFVAIDEEMTGIQVPGSGRPRRHRPPAEAYADLRAAPERYSIVQLGVALFHRDDSAERTAPAAAPEDEDEDGEVPEAARGGGPGAPSPIQRPAAEPTWTVHVYNFYMFPAGNGSGNGNNGGPAAAAATSREVVLNPATVHFLNQNNMSFDLWTREGVGYLPRDAARQVLSDYTLRAKRERRAAADALAPRSLPQTVRRAVELTRPEDVRFLGLTLATLREWLDAAAAPAAPLLLPACNAFLRRALYENIEKEYPDLVLESAGGGRIRVLRLTAEEKRDRERRLRREAWADMVHTVGMWRVFDALARACAGADIPLQSPLFAASYEDIDFETDAAPPPPPGRRVPLVVHNGWMDLLFLMTHFEAPRLPDSLAECKELVSSYFPVVYDTKVLATEYAALAPGETMSNLSNLYHAVVRENERLFHQIAVASAAGDPVEHSQQEHEAAYDAFMTGSIFVGLCRHIAAARHWNHPAPSSLGDLRHLDGDGEGPLLLTCEQRDHYGRNKIYQMSMFTLDLQNLETDGLKRGMMEGCSYHVSNIDPSVTTRDIIRCCSDLLDTSGQRVNFDIVWVDDNTFIVATVLRPDLILAEKEAASILLEHGGIIEAALRERFCKQEKIATLEEYFRAQKATDDAHWVRRAINRLVSYLFDPSKRKAEVDHAMAPANKRRRYS